MSKLRQTISKRDIWIVVIAAVLMIVSEGMQYYVMRNNLIDRVGQQAKSDLMLASQRIETSVAGIETAIDAMSYAVLQDTDHPEQIYNITQRVVSENPKLLSCVVAFTKGYFSPQRDSLYAPCSFREGNGYNRRLVNDYLDEDWYSAPAASRKAQWSEPCLAKGTDSTFVVVYSYPITNQQGRLVAVMAASIVTDSLTNAITGMRDYPGSYAVFESAGGHQLINNAQPVSQDDAQVFRTEIGKVGWKLAIICPDSDIYGKTTPVRWVAHALQVVSLLLLGFIVLSSLFSMRRLRLTTEEKERMDKELTEARSVQDTLVLRKPDQLPRNEHVTTSVRLINASEVGGDFYDCFTEGDNLFFCIGDVSGMGAAASLAMSMALSSFRTAVRHSSDPGTIMGDVNYSLCQMHGDRRTIKMLCGVLNLTTGLLQYSNAGMHSPILLADDLTTPLPVDDNPRIGAGARSLFTTQQQRIIADTKLFLYTDGLVEAENKKGEQWGEKRLQTHLAASVRQSPDDLIARIAKAVTDHSRKTQLPDDITLMCIRLQL